METETAMQIIDYPSPNYFTGHALPIRAIVLHGTAGGAAGALQELTNPKPNNPDAAVSANYLITRSGIIYRLVAYWLGRRAWANGRINKPDGAVGWLMACKRNAINPNLVTLSIEHEASSNDMIDHRTMPQPQIDASLWLTAKLLKDNNLRPSYQTVIGHNQIDSVTRANCPGVINPNNWIEIIQRI